MPRALAIALEITLASVSALLVLWLLYRALTRSEEEPRTLVVKWIITLACLLGLLLLMRIPPSLTRLLVPGLCVLIGLILTAVWAPLIGAWVAKPFTSLFDGGDEAIEPQPLYSPAINKMRKGEYQAAAFHIKQELMKFPNDFKGQHMLAQLQAQHLNDLAGAQVVIEHLINQPGHEPQNIVFALNELAEWQLKYGQDLEAARATLEKIVARFPGSDAAHHAQQRIAHLGTTESLLAPHDRRKLVVRPGPQNLGLMKDQSAFAAPQEDPVARADAYVKHLEENPFDHETREKLAWMYAEHFQRLDLALEQMEQLAADAAQPPRQRIRCLNTIADMQVKFGRDLEAARAALQRIIDLNPNSASAETARNRMDRLPLEIKASGQPHSIKMS